MKKGRLWMLALALASGDPFPAGDDRIRDRLSLDSRDLDTEPAGEEEGEEGKARLDLHPNEIGQIRTDAMEERLGKPSPLECVAGSPDDLAHRPIG